jgi:hypothetical protein
MSVSRIHHPARDPAPDADGRLWRRGVVLAGFFAASWTVGTLALGVAIVLVSLLDKSAQPWHGESTAMPVGAVAGLEWIVDSSLLVVETPVLFFVVTTMAVLQTMLLVPLVGPLRIRPNGWPLRVSVVGAAGIAGLSTAMIVYGVIEFTDEFFKTSVARQDAWEWFAVLLAVWTIAGGIWCWLLRRAGRSRDPRGLDRLVRLVFAATVVESILMVPLYVMLRKRLDCFCGAATFMGLCGGVAMLLWMCGPWALLLLTRRRREAWSVGACAGCGYSRLGGGDRCPECGVAYPSAVADATPD